MYDNNWMWDSMCRLLGKVWLQRNARFVLKERASLEFTFYGVYILWNIQGRWVLFEEYLLSEEYESPPEAEEITHLEMKNMILMNDLFAFFVYFYSFDFVWFKNTLFFLTSFHFQDFKGRSNSITNWKGC
jgi:hypothetical protein